MFPVYNTLLLLLEVLLVELVVLVVVLDDELDEEVDPEKIDFPEASCKLGVIILPAGIPKPAEKP